MSDSINLTIQEDEIIVMTISEGIQGPRGEVGASGLIDTTTLTKFNGIVKGNGNTVEQAVPDIDYSAPSTVNIIRTDLSNNVSALNTHVTKKDNPHEVTVGQIGAETPTGAQSKANTAETNARAYTDTHTIKANNPHAVTAAQVGAYTTAETDTALDLKLNLSDVVTAATANKVLRLDANAKAPFSILGSTPTTLSGYGITDAYTKTNVNELLVATSITAPVTGTLAAGSVAAQLAALESNKATMFAIASFPAHYERDAVWAQGSSRTKLLPPSYMTVNINNIGHILTAPAEIDINSTSNWDNSTYATAANRVGKDFYTYACQPISGNVPVIKLSINATIPTGYTANNSRKIGGYHCLCASVGTIAGHPLSGYLAGDILPASVWDLKHRPSSNPEGMVYSDQLNLWIDIYLQSGTGTSTKSVFNGVTADTRMWNDHVDDLAAVKKKLLDDTEFQVAAEGSNQQTNIAGGTDANTTGAHIDTSGRRMISNIGLEDCCGFLWQWLTDQSFRNGSGAEGWMGNIIGTKGGLYLMNDVGDVKLLAGGNWTNGAYCGSQSRAASNSRWNAYASIGSRGRAEPLRGIL